MCFKSFIKILVLIGITVNSNSIAQVFGHYPLEVGNYWEYYEPTYNYTSSARIVKDTVMNNGKSYAYFDRSFLGRYQRFENNCLYIYDSKLEQEFLLFDFSANPYTKINTFINDTDTTDVYFRYIYYDSLEYLNRKDSLWQFDVDWSRRYIEDEYYYDISDSIGVVKWIGGLSHAYLVWAIINNDTIGKVSDIFNTFDPVSLHINVSQNYPNPFNPLTTIEFSLPKSEFVTLIIYNILGEEVTTLVNDKLQAGNHTYQFDGSDLASGVYLYRIEAGEFQQVRKMVLIK